MKKLNTSLISTGIGYPPSKKGWDFLMQSYTEAIAELVKGIYGETYASNTPYVLYGCVKSNASTPFNYSAGAIFYNNELYEFPALTNKAIAISDVCTITTTADPTADPTEMTDGSSVNIHNIRAIVLSDAASVTNGATQFNFSSCVFIKDYWHYVGGTYSLGTSFQNSWANEGSGTYFNLSFKKVGNLVYLRGRIDTGSSGTTIFTLPVGYRPTFTAVVPIVSRAAGDYAYLQVTTAGNVSIVFGGTETAWFVDGVWFSTVDY